MSQYRAPPHQATTQAYHSIGTQPSQPLHGCPSLMTISPNVRVTKALLAAFLDTALGPFFSQTRRSRSWGSLHDHFTPYRREILEYSSGPFQLKLFTHRPTRPVSGLYTNRPTGHVYPFWVGELPHRTSQREESPAQRLKVQAEGSRARDSGGPW